MVNENRIITRFYVLTRMTYRIRYSCLFWTIGTLATTYLPILVIVYQYETINQQEFFPYFWRDRYVGPNETFGYTYMVVFFKREKGNEKKNISIEAGSKWEGTEEWHSKSRIMSCQLSSRAKSRKQLKKNSGRESWW